MFYETCADNIFTGVDGVNTKDHLGDNSTSNDKLKNLITGDIKVYEEKEGRKVVIWNYAILMYTWNDDKSVLISDDDRCRVVFDTVPEYHRDFVIVYNGHTIEIWKKMISVRLIIFR